MGTPLASAPAADFATSTHRCQGTRSTPKTPAGGSRGMGRGDSIPIVEGEIGPPRSGFVLRLCIRKADEAWGEASLALRPRGYKILQMTHPETFQKAMPSALSRG